MKLQALADGIYAYLKRFEADPTINAKNKQGLHPYYNARCFYSGGPKLRVVYVAYQGSSTMSKDDAERYLKRLQEGFVGRHWEALQEKR